MWSRFLRWAADLEGSSRSSALIRIGLALLIWTRWAAEVAPFYNPQPARLILAPALYVATSLMLVGLWTRLAVPAVALITGTMYLYGSLASTSAWAAHHTYLLVIATVYCALTPCGRSYSVDRWLAVRRARRLGLPIPPERGNLLGLRLIALQLSTIYFWGAVDKTHWGYFSGERIEQMLMLFYSGSDYPALPAFHAVCAALGTGTVVFEYWMAFGLFSAKLRPFLVPLGVLFHAALFAAVPVRTFSATVFLLYLAYFDADDIHAALDDVQARPAPHVG